jgi:hypothetical protein
MGVDAGTQQWQWSCQIFTARLDDGLQALPFIDWCFGGLRPVTATGATGKHTL